MHYSNSKTEQSNQNNLRISIPCSATYFLEMRRSVLLKVATKGCIRSKKKRQFSILETIFLKQKRCSPTEKM